MCLCLLLSGSWWTPRTHNSSHQKSFGVHANTPQPILPERKSDETNKFKCNMTWHDKSIASRAEAVLINRCSFWGIVKLVIALQIIKPVNHGVAPWSSRRQWIRWSGSDQGHENGSFSHREGCWHKFTPSIRTRHWVPGTRSSQQAKEQEAGDGEDMSSSWAL